MPSTFQQRITLRNLKVAEFASEETLCFSATVLFDGKPIAHASNDGHGGSTFLRPLQDPDSRDRLQEAESFAKSLPPDVTDYPDPNDSARKMTIEVTLDYLVDCLAEQQHTDKKVRSLFNRDMNNKVLFLKGDRLLFLKGIKPKTIADKPVFFAKLRAKQGDNIVILDELPREEAFARWKRHTVDGDPS